MFSSSHLLSPPERFEIGFLKRIARGDTFIEQSMQNA